MPDKRTDKKEEENPLSENGNPDSRQQAPVNVPTRTKTPPQKWKLN